MPKIISALHGCISRLPRDALRSAENNSGDTVGVTGGGGDGRWSASWVECFYWNSGVFNDNVAGRMFYGRSLDVLVAAHCGADGNNTFPMAPTSCRWRLRYIDPRDVTAAGGSELVIRAIGRRHLDGLVWEVRLPIIYRVLLVL